MDRLLRAAEVALIPNVSPSYIYKLADVGLLPCVRFSVPTAGKRKKETLRFKEADVRNFVQDAYS